MSVRLGIEAAAEYKRRPTHSLEEEGGAGRRSTSRLLQRNELTRDIRMPFDPHPSPSTVPAPPSARRRPPWKRTAWRSFSVPDSRSVHALPSGLSARTPLPPTATKREPLHVTPNRVRVVPAVPSVHEIASALE